MNFASDNAGPVHPAILAALAAANDGYAPSYGADPWTERARDLIREAFEAPEAAVYLVATGTAANSLILGTLAQPWDTIFTGRASHAQEDECNAPEFFTGGAKLTLVGAAEDRMTADELRRAIEREETRGVHGPQRGPISITTVSERGTVYTAGEIAEIGAVAREFGLSLHLDGARFANACAALGCTPAEMTWKAGVDAVSFGGTKNGCMGVEAVIFFDPAHAWEFELRRKRGAHLFSKGRYLGAQMAAYMADGLWLELARGANARADRLRAGLDAAGAEYAFRGGANMTFPRLPVATHARLAEAGVAYHMWPAEGDDEAHRSCRLVCDWSLPEAAIDRFLDLIRP